MKNTFIEIGAGKDGAWGIELIRNEYTGYFVEPHPGNLIALQKNLTDDPDIPPESYKLINACVWTKNDIKTMNTKEHLLSDVGISFHLDDSRDYYQKNRVRDIQTQFYVASITLELSLIHISEPTRPY